MIITSLLMNIGGSEWIIIGLMALFLFFGSKKLPEFSRTVGKAIGEYEKARNITKSEVLSQINLENNKAVYSGPRIEGPLQTERQKLEKIAQSLGISYNGINDEDLRLLILEKMKK
jgi:sec-independent protein translocase protein TatA